MIEKIVLRLLALKSRTTQEIRKKLSLRGFPSSEVEPVIQKFIRLGYLNDQEMAERRFQAYLKKGYSPRYVSLKMKQQGLIMPSYSLELQKRVISDLLKTAAFRHKTSQQQGAALQRRGFDLEVIFEVINPTGK